MKNNMVLVEQQHNKHNIIIISIVIVIVVIIFVTSTTIISYNGCYNNKLSIFNTTTTDSISRERFQSLTKKLIENNNNNNSTTKISTSNDCNTNNKNDARIIKETEILVSSIQQQQQQQQQEDEDQKVDNNKPMFESTTSTSSSSSFFTNKQKYLHKFNAINNYNTSNNNEQSEHNKDTKQENNNILNVHIVPHTHDDVGWRKTVEQYYYPNCNNSYDNRGNVQQIISTMIESLLQHPYRTFTYVEQKYFTMWYYDNSTSTYMSIVNDNDNDQCTTSTIYNSTSKTKIRNNNKYNIINYLVHDTKQLVFVNGGYSMVDEATTHYIGMIDNIQLGHYFLCNEFSIIPMIGWQLDPFGHSYTHANLLSLNSGLNSLFFGRIDYQDLQQRQNTQQCEGIWNFNMNHNNLQQEQEQQYQHEQQQQQQSSSSNNNELFWGLTGSYMGNYGPYSGYCFDPMCFTDNDYEDLLLNNSTRQYQRVLDFIQHIKLQSSQTIDNHIMITVGSDFHYQLAHYTFANYDLLISLLMYYQEYNIINITEIFSTTTTTSTTITTSTNNETNTNTNNASPIIYNKINIFYSNPEYYTYQKYLYTKYKNTQIQKQQQQQQNNQRIENNNTNSTTNSNAEQQQHTIRHDKQPNNNISNRNNQNSIHNIEQQKQKQQQQQQQQEVLPNKKQQQQQSSTSSTTTSTIQNNKIWDTKYDDFFPYSDCAHCFWTGYFTSRTAFKRFERYSTSLLHAARQIDSMAITMIIESITTTKTNIDKNNNSTETIVVDSNNDDSTTVTSNSTVIMSKIKRQRQRQHQRKLQKEHGHDFLKEVGTIYDSPLYPLEDAVAIVQHHDAVAGTAKQHVAFDYSYKLQYGINMIVPYLINILRSIMIKDADNKNMITTAATATSNTSTPMTNNNSCVLCDLTLCQQLNETKCSVSQKATQVGTNDTALYVIVYNQLAQMNRSSYISLPVSDGTVSYKIERVQNTIDRSELQYPTVRIINPTRTFVYPYCDLVSLHNDSKSNEYEDNCNGSEYTLKFETDILPPMGAITFRITKAQSLVSTSESDMSEQQQQQQQKQARTAISQYKKSKKVNHQFNFNIDDCGNDNEDISDQIVEVNNGYLVVRMNASTGMIIQVESINNAASDDNINNTTMNNVMDMTQLWGYYPSYFSTNATGSDVNSGAYIFRPQVPDQDIIPLSPKVNGSTFVTTSVGTTVHITFEENWISLELTVYTNKPYIEVTYTIGPVPIDDNIGKEIVTRYTTSIQNNGIFYTDSNGRQYMKRTRNYRDPKWNWTNYEPVSGNYYPVNTGIYIEDCCNDNTNKSSLSSLVVLVDRSQGGTSLSDGTVELMVQRRTIGDDARGVDEAMNETTGGVSPYPPYGDATRIGNGVIIKGTHRIVFGTSTTTSTTSTGSTTTASNKLNNGKRQSSSSATFSPGASIARSLMDDTFATPLVFVGSESISNEIQFDNPSFTGIGSGSSSSSSSTTNNSDDTTIIVPTNLMLITFMRLHHRIDNIVFLIRLGHQYDTYDDPVLSQPISINIDQYVTGLINVKKKYNIISILQKTLPGSENYNDYLQRRYDWSSTNTDDNSNNHNNIDKDKQYSSITRRLKEHEVDTTNTFGSDNNNDDYFLGTITILPMEIVTFEVVVAEM